MLHVLTVTSKNLFLSLDTDLKGEQIPEGKYNALIETDLRNQLNIQDFNGQVMNGSVFLKKKSL